MVLLREPDDDADGSVAVIGVRQAPQRVTSRLLDALEGRGFLGRWLGKVLQFCQQGDRPLERGAARLLYRIEPGAEVRCPINQYCNSMPRRDYAKQGMFQCPLWHPLPTGGALTRSIWA